MTKQPMRIQQNTNINQVNETWVVYIFNNSKKLDDEKIFFIQILKYSFVFFTSVVSIVLSVTIEIGLSVISVNILTLGFRTFSIIKKIHCYKLSKIIISFNILLHSSQVTLVLHSPTPGLYEPPITRFIPK